MFDVLQSTFHLLAVEWHTILTDLVSLQIQDAWDDSCREVAREVGTLPTLCEKGGN